MKAIIPLAGKGTRLRPHTFATPKPLLRVGGRPVMSYILDDLQELGIEEMVFVVGYLRDVVREYIEDEYPDITGHYVVQEVQDGTAGALRLAAPYVDEEVLILFVDTLFDADLSLVRSLPEEWSGVIWAKEVEDYQHFGVILTDETGAMTRIVEKPSEPVSRLANIGLYFIRDHKLLFEGIEHTLNSGPGPSGEYYLTDAFQYMVDQGARIRTAPVAGWYDCGKLETLLDTNRHLLETTRGGVDPDAVVENTTLVQPVRIEEGVVVRDSSIGPNVTLERGVLVEGSTLANVIVGDGASIESSSLRDSMVGSRARISGFSGTLSVAADSEVAG
ncbi:MAG: NTP transferase domain-containing protein [Gemmatimonadetes bacterium]|nr:NTP transferase domain-containing protein [Gemmatimonadota bacterium]